MNDFLSKFFTFYGVLNLGFHISIVLVSSITKFNPNQSETSSTESDPGSDQVPESESESELESESDTDTDPGSDQDPDYIQPSNLTINLRKRKTI
jgi:hypothetical protein